MYKIETHLHTTHTSKCGWLTAPEIIARYQELGFDAIAVTDHYNYDTWNYKGIDIENPAGALDVFLEGYRRMCEEGAKAGIKIYMGAELRFFENHNDYLYYGFDEKLLENPKEIIGMGVVKFSEYNRTLGGVLVHAHPFRNGCVPVDPSLLDGVEVLNLNPRHDSRNELAHAYAERYGLVRTAGSDCHRPGDEGTAGILSETLPEDSMAFAQLIRSGAFTLLGETENNG